jgi:hypothetical protein
MEGAILPSSYRLPASRRITPLQQGELDGLCGVYSVINAIRLLRLDADAITRREVNALYSFAIYRLAESGDLRDRMARGVPWAMLKHVAAKTVSVASTDRTKLELRTLPRGNADRFELVKQAVQAGQVLLVSTHHDEHYSLVVGWTPTRAVLFDSSAGQWVPLASISKSLCFAIRARPVTPDKSE